MSFCVYFIELWTSWREGPEAFEIQELRESFSF
jgi:hypothetical protein